MATMTPSRVDELLAVEERDAWQHYLRDIQNQPEPRYSELEPWAWSRLQSKLRAIDSRRRILTTDVRV